MPRGFYRATNTLFRQVVLADPSAAAGALQLSERHAGMAAFKSVRIDGSISSSTERQARIARFNSDTSINVFLLTTQCGGVGITLNGADRVIIFDPAWNPAVDAQAVDRCYRVGQTRDVIVYRFITCGTIEEKVYRKQVFKGGLERVCPPPQSYNQNPYSS